MTPLRNQTNKGTGTAFGGLSPGSFDGVETQIVYDGGIDGDDWVFLVVS